MSEATDSVLPEAAVGQTEFLHQQAEQAQLAIGQALANARAALAEGMDPREWTKKYPIVAVGSALVAGFAAAVMTIPSKEQQEITRLQRIQEALHPEPKEKSNGNGQPKPAEPMWMKLLHEAVQLIRPVLGSLLFAGIKSQAAPAPDYGTTGTAADVHDNKASR
jgi:hypothetical protein